MSDVTIVIPNYNGIAFLKTCLDSVLAQTGVQMDVIIIDNGSVDGSQEFISSNYPQCELVCLDQNYGFCRAVNNMTYGLFALLIPSLTARQNP